VIKRWSSSSKL